MVLSVIIVNWNSAGYLKGCLSSIYAETAGIDFEVLVVDNASYDGCAELLEREFPSVKFIQSKANCGFAAANNLGVAHSSGRVLLFLNPDTQVRGSALATMLSVFRAQPNAGIVGCRLLNGDLTLQASCVQAFPTVWNEFLDCEHLRKAFPKSRLWGNAVLYVRERGMFHVEAVSGACLMIRRDVFETVGRFNTRYFMYVEDRDLCYAARRTGYLAYFVNTAEVIHYGGTSSGARSENNFGVVMRCESLRKFMRYRRGRPYAVAYRSAVALSACCRLIALWLAAAIRGQMGAGAVLRGAIRKWWAVLRWSLGLEPWARAYTAPANRTATGAAPPGSSASATPSIADAEARRTF